MFDIKMILKTGFFTSAVFLVGSTNSQNKKSNYFYNICDSDSTGGCSLKLFDTEFIVFECKSNINTSYRSFKTKSANMNISELNYQKSVIIGFNVENIYLIILIFALLSCLTINKIGLNSKSLNILI